jgi:hypothetical protein
MPKIVLVILTYHRYKLVDLTSIQSNFIPTYTLTLLSLTSILILFFHTIVGLVCACFRFLRADHATPLLSAKVHAKFANKRQSLGRYISL